MSQVAHVALAMIHNGKLSVGVDLRRQPRGRARPIPRRSAVERSAARSRTSCLLRLGVIVKAILTTGDSPNLKPDGVTPWRMVGIPDGAGALDNGDGTFTLFNNQELTPTVGISAPRTARRGHSYRSTSFAKRICCPARRGSDSEGRCCGTRSRRLTTRRRPETCFSVSARPICRRRPRCSMPRAALVSTVACSSTAKRQTARPGLTASTASATSWLASARRAGKTSC